MRKLILIGFSVYTLLMIIFISSCHYVFSSGLAKDAAIAAGKELKDIAAEIDAHETIDK